MAVKDALTSICTGCIVERESNRAFGVVKDGVELPVRQLVLEIHQAQFVIKSHITVHDLVDPNEQHTHAEPLARETANVNPGSGTYNLHLPVHREFACTYIVPMLSLMLKLSGGVGLQIYDG